MDRVMDDTSTKKPSIPEWFRNRDVLVTGGTGFMGKLLLAKLLLSCPDIGKIYVLIRDKKGVPSKSRLTTLLQVYNILINIRIKHNQRFVKILLEL